MREVYIIGGLRTHIGLKNGMFRHISAEMLGAALLDAVIKKYGVPDRFICANAVGGGGNIARLIARTAGHDLPSLTVDSQCASGLDAVRTAATEISAGICDCIICGGAESASTQPIREYNPNHPDYGRRLSENRIRYMTAKFSEKEHEEDTMLRAAENTAKIYGIHREDTDRFVIDSHMRASNARCRDYIADIIHPVFGSEHDEGIRENMNRRLLGRVRPVLDGGSVITAANSCLINDGAAFLFLCSEEYAKKHSLLPAAKIIGFADAAVEPMLAPTAAVSVVRSLTEKYGKADCMEVNEAFALIDLLIEREIQDMRGYNIFGGALAYGHPYGASGAVILLHLLKALERTGGKTGFAAIAAAGGLGSGIAIEGMTA